MQTLRTWAFAAASVLPAVAFAGVPPPQNALQFAAGDDRVALSALPAFVNDLSQDFTITLWLRLDGASTQRVFFAQVDGSNFATLLFSIDHRPFLYVADAGVTYSTSGAPIAPGVWTHLALRWNAAATTPEILIDGVLQPFSAGGASSSGTNGVMMLGARTDGAQALNGALEDFAIWGSLRSTAQIRAERVSSCIVGNGLQARYDFNVGVPGGDNTGLTTGGHVTNFYYCAHESTERNHIEILAVDGSTLRVRLRGETVDVNYYDGSRPPTVLTAELDLLHDPRTRRSMG